MPSATPKRLAELIELFQKVDLPCRIVPSMAQLAMGDVSISQLRRVEIEDLLGREPVSFLTLFLWLYAAPLAVALVGGALAGAVAAGPMQGLQAGVTGATGIFVLGWMHFLHRMIRSERNTALSTGLDFLNALLLSAVEVSLAPFYIALRGLILVRAASRRRWLDR